MPVYTNKVVWKGGHFGYTYCENGTEMEFSAPPALYGHPNMMTPEDAFVMAVNTCVHMMVIWAAERLQLDLVAFECVAEGEVEEFLDRTSWFKKLVLRPKLTVRSASRKKVERALEMARKYSTIAESVKSEVIIDPEIEIVE
ncbi:MAG: OsmC family protein [Syntrophothermus sp.]|uniref:OsmC family protein n=1 Tax=Syntrophothermus sp. TaxID=2736299 RepID=UPI00257EDC41|nr:OsmC family protein [Syntrophothermus sp.]NSW82644.1 OsmC family protein [Syntrophothermus sp.]